MAVFIRHTVATCIKSGIFLGAVCGLPLVAHSLWDFPLMTVLAALVTLTMVTTSPLTRSGLDAMMARLTQSRAGTSSAMLIMSLLMTVCLYIALTVVGTLFGITVTTARIFAAILSLAFLPTTFLLLSYIFIRSR